LQNIIQPALVLLLYSILSDNPSPTFRVHSGLTAKLKIKFATPEKLLNTTAIFGKVFR